MDVRRTSRSQLSEQTRCDGRVADFSGPNCGSGFVERLTGELKALGAQSDDDLFFICRSGGRSLAAAKTMAEAGYRACHNVAGGFEGPLDDDRHRGFAGGWKATGLPWIQG